MRKQELNRRLKRVRYLALDGDGVLFPNDAWEGFEVNGVSLKPKLRSHYDGQGLSFLRGLGVRVCVITNAEGVDGQAARELVTRWNNLPSAKKEGGWPSVELLSGYDGKDKLAALTMWLNRHGGQLEQCAVMGNDIGDYFMLQEAGLKTCPVDAEPRILRGCDFIASRPGGKGAVRDLCNAILSACDIDPTTLSLK